MAGFWNKVVEKLNPVQDEIAREEGSNKGSTQTNKVTVDNAYELVEVVNRCINTIVDNASLVHFDIKDSLPFTGQAGGVKAKTLNTLLNHRPNPFMDISTFRRLVLMDFLIDGNAFMYFDGAGLYHLPAHNVTINMSDKGYVANFTYNERELKTREVIHIKDNSTTSVVRGDSRINCALESLYTREFMLNYQKSYFKNGTSMGLIIETEEILNKKMKERDEREIMQKFNPQRSSNRPLILDGGKKAKTGGNSNFREMAFSESIKDLEKNVCLALGVPPILLDSGNNANLKPNIELWFHTQILPMMKKWEAAYEFFFAFDIETTTHKVPALQPDRKTQAEWISSLVNNGLMLGNEGREELRLPKIEDDPNMDKIRIPANIAGSSTGVSGQEGGAPSKEE